VQNNTLGTKNNRRVSPDGVAGEALTRFDDTAAVAPGYWPDRTPYSVRMKSIAIKVLVNGIALWVAALVVNGIKLGEDAKALSNRLLTILVVAVLFGLVNALIKPVLKFFSAPFIVLTLGLFTLVINAVLLQLTSWFAKQLQLDFHVDRFFWDAVLGAIVITFVSMILHLLLPDGDE
jgi:putative membrane protein